MMDRISRREFIKKTSAMGIAACTGACAKTAMAFLPERNDIRGKVFKGDAPKRPWKWSKEGYSYAALPDGKVSCKICPNRCVLSPGDRSICRSKVNINGKLFTLAYGNPCAAHIDPVEKKPLFHFHPSTKAFSIAAAGCNFRCLNCQNWEISQFRPEDLKNMELFPAQVVKRAKESGCTSIAYTYSEAITFFEYMIDTAKAARSEGIFNLFISNGFINRSPLLDLSSFIDAANINLKSFDDGIYRCLNGGRLKPVQRSLTTLVNKGVHLEVTTLVVPGYVDDKEMMKRMFAWVIKALGPDIPFHLLRFFPRYKLSRLPPTPVRLLEEFRDLAINSGLRYVYIGNVPGHPGCHTYCPSCRKPVIQRAGFFVKNFDILNGRCRFCREKIAGIWPGKG